MDHPPLHYGITTDVHYVVWPTSDICLFYSVFGFRKNTFAKYMSETEKGWLHWWHVACTWSKKWNNLWWFLNQYVAGFQPFGLMPDQLHLLYKLCLRSKKTRSRAKNQDIQDIQKNQRCPHTAFSEHDG